MTQTVATDRIASPFCVISSWLNQIDAWLTKITEQRLRRSAFHPSPSWKSHPPRFRHQLQVDVFRLAEELG